MNRLMMDAELIDLSSETSELFQQTRNCCQMPNLSGINHAKPIVHGEPNPCLRIFQISTSLTSRRRLLRRFSRAYRRENSLGEKVPLITLEQPKHPNAITSPRHLPNLSAGRRERKFNVNNWQSEKDFFI